MGTLARWASNRLATANPCTTLDLLDLCSTVARLARPLLDLCSTFWAWVARLARPLLDLSSTFSGSCSPLLTRKDAKEPVCGPRRALGYVSNRFWLDLAGSSHLRCNPTQIVSESAGFTQDPGDSGSPQPCLGRNWQFPMQSCDFRAKFAFLEAKLAAHVHYRSVRDGTRAASHLNWQKWENLDMANLGKAQTQAHGSASTTTVNGQRSAGCQGLLRSHVIIGTCSQGICPSTNPPKAWHSHTIPMP